jgi:hypothetical protein
VLGVVFKVLKHFPFSFAFVVFKDVLKTCWVIFAKQLDQ